VHADLNKLLQDLNLENEKLTVKNTDLETELQETLSTMTALKEAVTDKLSRYMVRFVCKL
jgi:uncharacterized protein YqgV (UPF0045/DUF77 family)